MKNMKTLLVTEILNESPFLSSFIGLENAKVMLKKFLMRRFVKMMWVIYIHATFICVTFTTL